MRAFISVRDVDTIYNRAIITINIIQQLTLINIYVLIQEIINISIQQLAHIIIPQVTFLEEDGNLESQEVLLLRG